MADRQIFIDDSPKNPKNKKSHFDLSFVNNLTAKFGKVNLAYCQYCPPSTKLRIKPSFAFNLHSLVYPTQTNVRAHLKFYKIPLRILWKDWEDFQSMLGSNGLPTNAGGSQLVVPYIKRPSGWNGLGTIAEQLGASNIRLVNQNSIVQLEGVRRSINSNFLLPYRSSFVRFSCYDLKIPSQYILKTQSMGIIQSKSSDIIIPYLDMFDSAVGNGILYCSLLVENSSGLSLVDTISLYNSLISDYPIADSCYALTSGSSYILDGFTVKMHECHINLGGGAFYEKVNKLLSSGLDVTLRFYSSSSIATTFFPSSSRDIGISALDISTLTKVEPDTGNVTSLTSTQYLYKSLGVCSLSSVAVSSVGQSTHTLFDSVGGVDPVKPVSALPFRAMEFIHNYFMRNPRIDPFIKDGVPTYNRFLTNDGSGADETTPVESWNALFETDYFTSCVKEPQFGNAPLVGVTVNDLSDKGILRFDDGEGYNNYTVEVPLDADGKALPITMYKDIADKPNIHRLQEIIDFGISINDLRNVSTFQRMLERMQRTGYRYKNVVYEFFGTNPPIGDHYPQYVGGKTANIMVDEITQTSETEQKKLGEIAGKARFAAQGRNINVFCSEASYVIGILYFTVTPTYSQYVPKHLFYNHPLDFYLNPDFAFMGPQPVYQYEIAAGQMDAEHIDDIFGYNRPYAELFQRVDEVHGNFKTDQANFLLQRMFAGAPNLNKSFIEIQPEQLLNIFAVNENTDKIYGQVKFNVHAVLPAPRSYSPRTI